MAKKYHYEEIRVNEFAYNFGILQIALAICGGAVVIFLLANDVAFTDEYFITFVANLCFAILNLVMGSHNVEVGDEKKKIRVYDPEPPKPGIKVDDETARKALLGEKR